jgi:hypothetical protein
VGALVRVDPEGTIVLSPLRHEGTRDRPAGTIQSGHATLLLSHAVRSLASGGPHEPQWPRTAGNRWSEPAGLVKVSTEFNGTSLCQPAAVRGNRY